MKPPKRLRPDQRPANWDIMTPEQRFNHAICNAEPNERLPVGVFIDLEQHDIEEDMKSRYADIRSIL